MAGIAGSDQLEKDTAPSRRVKIVSYAYKARIDRDAARGRPGASGMAHGRRQTAPVRLSLLAANAVIETAHAHAFAPALGEGPLNSGVPAVVSAKAPGPFALFLCCRNGRATVGKPVV